MKKQYEFSSALPPQEIFTRLQYRSRPLKSGWDPYDAGQFFHKLLSQNRFYLLQTGGAFSVRPQLPFLGRVTPVGQGSCITGAFRLTLGTRRKIWVFLLGALASILIGTISSGYPQELWIMLPVWGIWSAFILLLVTRLPRLFTRTQDAAALEFIEKNLLR